MVRRAPFVPYREATAARVVFEWEHAAPPDPFAFRGLVFSRRSFAFFLMQ